MMLEWGLKIAGFCAWWLIVAMVYYKIFYSRDKMLNLRKYVQMIMYIMCSLGGYLLTFLFLEIWNQYVAIVSSLIGAIVLTFVWYIVFWFIKWIWKINTEEGENIIDLSVNEKNWCNTISIVGMIVLGLILCIMEKASTYLEISSLALSIWMGSYISIQDVQNETKNLKHFFEGLTKNFQLSDYRIPVAGSICMIIVLIVFSFKNLQMNFNKFSMGYGVGVVSFLIIALLIEKYKPELFNGLCRK